MGLLLVHRTGVSSIFLGITSTTVAKTNGPLSSPTQKRHCDPLFEWGGEGHLAPLVENL